MSKLISQNSNIITLETRVSIEYTGSIENTIRNRHSCRAYTNEIFSNNQISGLEQALKSEKKGLLGENAHFRLVKANNHIGEKVQIGTYGMIKNPRAAIVGEIEKSEMAYESYGFLMQQYVLLAEQLGLNTCWLGFYNTEGSENFFNILNRLSSEKIIVNNENITPAICVVGYGSEKTGLWDKASKIIAKPDKRKPFEEIFYISEYGKPLAAETAGRYFKPLEMVRLAPSAGNMQPWRVIMQERKEGGEEPILNFYMKPSNRPDYNMLKLHNIDMGIGLCDFELMAKELGYSGRWEINKPMISVPKNVYYTASWIPEKIGK
jgi:nitroreductase